MRSYAAGALLGAIVWTSGCARMDAPPPPSSRPSPALTFSSEREIKYTIEREDNGSAIASSEDFIFKSGDRFRVRFRPGFSAYLYVVNRGSHEASYQVLFPAGGEMKRNPLAKDADATVPIDVPWLRFDKTPGNEYLLLIASTVELPDLEKQTQIPRDTFEAQLAEIERRLQPASSRRIAGPNGTKLMAGKEGDLAFVARLALRHQ